MKTVEMRAQTDDQLLTKVQELKKENMHLRFQVATGGQIKTSRVREIKKSIAMIKTILVERKLKGRKGNA
jgi:large subunit ribosomal protein L29